MFLSTVVVVLVVSLTSIVNCEDADCNNNDEGEHCCLSCCPKLARPFHQYVYHCFTPNLCSGIAIAIDLISYIMASEISKNSLRCSYLCCFFHFELLLCFKNHRLGAVRSLLKFMKHIAIISYLWYS